MASIGVRRARVGVGSTLFLPPNSRPEVLGEGGERLVAHRSENGGPSKAAGPLCTTDDEHGSVPREGGGSCARYYTSRGLRTF